MATHLYRIAQEAVSNALKHGGGDHVQIELNGDKRTLGCQCWTTGPASERSKRSPGMGLRIMQYRAGLIGGTRADRAGGNLRDVRNLPGFAGCEYLP